MPLDIYLFCNKNFFIFRAAQALGSSVDWQDIWRNLTGTDQINANALIEYFKPATNYMNVHADDTSFYWWAVGVGILVIIVIIIIVLVYFIRKSRNNKKKHLAERAANANPVAVEEGQVTDEGTYNGLESMDLGEGSGK